MKQLNYTEENINSLLGIFASYIIGRVVYRHADGMYIDIITGEAITRKELIIRFWDWMEKD